MTDEIKFQDTVVGEGKEAKKGALITAHYRGLLEDGTEFDSSYAKGRPFQTVLSKNKVIHESCGYRPHWVTENEKLARSRQTVSSILKLN